MGPTAVIDILFHNISDLFKSTSFAFSAASTSDVMSVMVMHKCHSVKNFMVRLNFDNVSCSRNYSFHLARHCSQHGHRQCCSFLNPYGGYQENRQSYIEVAPVGKVFKAIAVGTHCDGPHLVNVGVDINIRTFSAVEDLNVRAYLWKSKEPGVVCCANTTVHVDCLLHNALTKIDQPYTFFFESPRSSSLTNNVLLTMRSWTTTSIYLSFGEIYWLSNMKRNHLYFSLTNLRLHPQMAA
ncbi:hypothetical protein C8R42DRAFT_105509 [Lentinula raphanica]|nr:hypothetical protein C8R42DRAFT_105509 [Lentinula raphanica]